MDRRGMKRWATYAAALGLAMLGYVARLGLQPVFGANHAYTAFYPVVLVSAYAFGAGPAILAALVSATLGYWCFAAPAHAVKLDADSLTSLGFFAVTSSSAIYLIHGLARAVAATREAQARAETLAKAHAALFGELNERVTNHLQLVAALLQLQARDEPDAAARKALGEAAARTMLISKTHRSIAGEGGELLDFDAFARQLLEATLSARANPPLRVEFEQGGLWLSSEQATSVAIVLLECLNARLASEDPGVMRIGLRADRGIGSLRIIEIERPLDPIAPRGASLIDAMVEQLRGRFSSRNAAEGRVSELTFPLEGGHGQRRALEATLH
ncbi:histidine kinase dimerization/phosphoacceptor domain -containing protein [Caulobacter sp.]|uniref:histidine kinase dimerization/phosphoacceptor domain -containing protein n=1 Tax=Caulobacter sp. TaxID=78 RepID=UPI002B4798DE|nr:histidine kinase dimerization/phosphoacceptor domain -containing protein [Caulobacter sp.]HJV40628.1 histidine kinase dimerization/phosphoacceptor domain -containing protein [Caulobacter sp.]